MFVFIKPQIILFTPPPQLVQSHLEVWPSARLLRALASWGSSANWICIFFFPSSKQLRKIPNNPKPNQTLAEPHQAQHPALQVNHLQPGSSNQVLGLFSDRPIQVLWVPYVSFLIQKIKYTTRLHFLWYRFGHTVAKERPWDPWVWRLTCGCVHLIPINVKKPNNLSCSIHSSALPFPILFP